MKNKKLSLDNLEVRSFVTNLQGAEADTVKGGIMTITTFTNTIRASARTDIGCCPDAK